jgi:hypothetical protein
VRAPVDLDEFAEAGPAFANLENLLDPPSLGPPQPQPDLDLPDRFFRNPDALDLADPGSQSGGSRRNGRSASATLFRSPRPSPYRACCSTAVPAGARPRSPRPRFDSRKPTASPAERQRPEAPPRALVAARPASHAPRRQAVPAPPRSAPKHPRSNRPPSASTKGDISTLLKRDIPTLP